MRRYLHILYFIFIQDFGAKVVTCIVALATCIQNSKVRILPDFDSHTSLLNARVCYLCVLKNKPDPTVFTFSLNETMFQDHVTCLLPHFLFPTVI